MVFAVTAGLNSPVEPNSTQSIPAYKLADAQGCKYWVNKVTHKRHNKECKWYKNCNGYCADEKLLRLNPTEWEEGGITCKTCGGLIKISSGFIYVTATMDNEIKKNRKVE